MTCASCISLSASLHDLIENNAAVTAMRTYLVSLSPECIQLKLKTSCMARLTDAFRKTTHLFLLCARVINR